MHCITCNELMVAEREGNWTYYECVGCGARQDVTDASEPSDTGGPSREPDLEREA